MAGRDSARRVLVTGATSGIGRATVKRMVDRGWLAVALGRRSDLLSSLQSETGCDVIAADVTVSSEIQSAKDFVVSSGGISALVNNAGGAIGLEIVEEASPKDWATMFDVNVLGVQRLIKAFLPLLRESASETGVSDILTVSSTAAFVSYEGGAGYTAAKSAVHSMMSGLRLELSGEPIRVVEVAPGMVKTEEFALNRFRGDEGRVEDLYRNVESPLLAEDIAEVICFALELAPHINLDLIKVKPVAQAAQHKLHRGPLKTKF